jgi:hypothetical protein
MTPHQYRAMLTRAIEAGNNELLDSICTVLAENEAAKSILLHMGCGPASDGIDAMVKRIPERIK